MKAEGGLTLLSVDSLSGIDTSGGKSFGLTLSLSEEEEITAPRFSRSLRILKPDTLTVPA